MIDIGANLTHASFRDDLDAVVARARGAGVSTLVVTGTTVEESRVATDIAERLDLYATAGVHPHHARDCNEKTIGQLRDIARHPRIVAIGECGLDFNRNYSPHPDQEKWFVEQLRLGLELGKPLFLHSRDAHPRFADIVRREKVQQAVAHCFTGEKDELHAYLDLGLYIGITGWICDERRGAHLLQLVREIPRDRLLLETDAPLPHSARLAAPAQGAAQRAGIPAAHPEDRRPRPRPRAGRGGGGDDTQRSDALRHP